MSMASRIDRAYLSLIAGFVLVIALVGSALWLTQYQERAFNGIVHTLRVENGLRMVLSHLQDAEAGQRGYLLTRDRTFLAPYETSLERFERDLGVLERAISNNSDQHARLHKLRAVARARQDILRTSIILFDNSNSHAIAPDRLQRGKVLMDQARALVGEMIQQEERLLAERVAGQTLIANLLGVGLLLLTLILIGLGIFAARDAKKRIRSALKDAEALAAVNHSLSTEAASRETAEGQVRQMQKMEAVGQLTGGIAHDFNNMLTIIIGSLDMAKRKLDSDRPRADKCIDNAMEGAQRATQLTGRLLAFSRQQPLVPRVLDMNKLVGSMSELLRRTLGEQMRVETILAGGLWRVHADAGQVENAVLNLCVNGRDAMPDGGKLTIETSNAHLDDAYAATHAEVVPGQYAVVSVTDTGTGMPREVAERAFDPFYTTKGPDKGTGLGLSQVYGFVKQSGGHIMIYSEQGVGTTVKLYLPRHYGDERVAEPEAARIADLPRARDEEIVLVVEDDDRVRHLSIDTLRELGYTVVQASDGVQALAVLSLQPRVDLLFTDIIMPGMNGRVLADTARATRPELKVLYTTGYTRNAIVHNGMLDPGVHFLAKPFTFEQLAFKVREVLDASDEG